MDNCNGELALVKILRIQDGKLSSLLEWPYLTEFIYNLGCTLYALYELYVCIHMHKRASCIAMHKWVDLSLIKILVQQTNLHNIT